MSDAPEIELKRWLRSTWTGWSEAYEPARGGGMGIPDVQLLVAGRWLYPVELKVATIGSGRVWPERVRPAQIRWHREFAAAGGAAGAILGVHGAGGWLCYLLHGVALPQWRAGYACAGLARFTEADLNAVVTQFAMAHIHGSAK